MWPLARLLCRLLRHDWRDHPCCVLCDAAWRKAFPE